MQRNTLQNVIGGSFLFFISCSHSVFAGTNVGVTTGAGFGPTITSGASESLEVLEEKGTTYNVTQQMYSIGESMPIPEFGGHQDVQTLIKTQSSSITNYDTNGTSTSNTQDYTTGIKYDFNHEVSGGIGY